MNGIEKGVQTVFSSLLNDGEKDKSPKDYYDGEGFLMCGNCNDRKQADEDLSCIGLGIRRRKRLCKCELEKKKEMELLAEKQKRLEEIKILRERGLSDPQYLKCRIENDDRLNARISDAIVRYVNKWDEMKAKNMGLIFLGGVGTGKTFYAGCIANMLLDKGIPVLMTNIPALITAMTQDFEKNKAAILNRISQIPLLILDDLGIERGTEYSYEKLQEIIDTRYRSGKPLIITTNLTKKEIKEPSDIRYGRVYDRILEMCVFISMSGESRRGKNAQKNIKEFKKILLGD